MTREEEMLQAAADTLKVFRSSFVKSIERIWVTAFTTGAYWADRHQQNVWHEAKEKPRAKEYILVQFSGGDYETFALDELVVETWSDWWCDNYKVIRWAYISDLLPKGGAK